MNVNREIVLVNVMEKLIEKTNQAIAELVTEKVHLQKAYNYYNGIRDPEQFRYLEENFGIGNPTSVTFVPLIKKHIDALIGEYLSSVINPKVSCKDADTISKITREKELTILTEVSEFLQSKLKSKLMEHLQTGDDKSLTDPSIKEEIDRLMENLDQSFVSSFEIAAQNVVEYLMQSRKTDFKNKLKTMLLDILITGYSYFRAYPSANNSNVEIEALSPLNTFIDKNPNSPYVKDSYRSVVRKYLTRTQILNIYGKDLTKEDVDKIKDLWRNDYGSHYYVRQHLSDCNGMPSTMGIRAGEEITPTQSIEDYNHELIPVYEVEWLETDDDFVMQRYSTIRIADSIYILKGKDENVIRDPDNPTYCHLTLNGVYFVNRNNEPYSLMLACMNLQDQYDILHFYRNNLIANSGTTGDWVDVSMLPNFLGKDLSEKLQKWFAYKKGGVALVDSSQEGRVAAGMQPMNTIYNGYDDTVKVQAVQAVQLAIDATETTASSITGVFRERLNGIEQRDAVSNIKLGAQNSFVITKQYYQQMDLITEEALLDALNVAKVVYKNGLTGVLILGDKQQKVFTALPEKFTLTSHDIHITATTDAIKDIEYIKQVIPEFIKSQSLDPSIIFEAMTCKSLTSLKQKVKMAMAKQKEENNQLQQLSQQLQQSQSQIKELENALRQSQSQIKEAESQRMQLEQQKLHLSNELDWFKAKTERAYKEASIEEEKRRTDVEISQLNDGNPYNDTLRKI